MFEKTQVLTAKQSKQDVSGWEKRRGLLKHTLCSFASTLLVSSSLFLSASYYTKNTHKIGFLTHRYTVWLQSIVTVNPVITWWSKAVYASISKHIKVSILHITRILISDYAKNYLNDFLPREIWQKPQDFRLLNCTAKPKVPLKCNFLMSTFILMVRLVLSLKRVHCAAFLTPQGEPDTCWERK